MFSQSLNKTKHYSSELDKYCFLRVSSKVEPPLPSSQKFTSCVCSTNLWLIVESFVSNITTSVVEFLFDLPTEFSGSNQTTIHPSVGTSLAESKLLIVGWSTDQRPCWVVLAIVCHTYSMPMPHLCAKPTAFSFGNLSVWKHCTQAVHWIILLSETMLCFSKYPGLR